MYFSSKRQQYLVDQGYTFKIVQDLAARADKETQVLGTKDKEADILQCILGMSQKIGVYDHEEDRALAVSSRGEYDSDEESSRQASSRTGIHQAKRRITDLNSLSGGDGMLYAEFKSGK
jgi:DNA excision repair protein ERCC-3